MEHLHLHECGTNLCMNAHTVHWKLTCSSSVVTDMECLQYKQKHSTSHKLQLCVCVCVCVFMGEWVDLSTYTLLKSQLTAISSSLVCRLESKAKRSEMQAWIYVYSCYKCTHLYSRLDGHRVQCC